MAEIDLSSSRPDAIVSVVIPVYNGACYLGAAIDSVLAQAEVREVLVIDDGSTDDTPAVAYARTDPRLHYERQEQQGTAAARNRGVALATGKLLAFLDADDLWLPGKLAAQLPLLRDGVGEMIFTQMEEFVSPELTARQAAGLSPRSLLSGMSAVTMLLRKADFLAVGPFDPSVGTGEFVHWYARASEHGLRSHTLAQVLVRRRLHLTNYTRLHAAERADYAGILREMLVRRRKATGS